MVGMVAHVGGDGLLARQTPGPAVGAKGNSARPSSAHRATHAAMSLSSSSCGPWRHRSGPSPTWTYRSASATDRPPRWSAPIGHSPSTPSARRTPQPSRQRTPASPPCRTVEFPVRVRGRASVTSVPRQRLPPNSSRTLAEDRSPACVPTSGQRPYYAVGTTHSASVRSPRPGPQRPTHDAVTWSVGRVLGEVPPFAGVGPEEGRRLRPVRGGFGALRARTVLGDW